MRSLQPLTRLDPKPIRLERIEAAAPLGDALDETDAEPYDDADIEAVRAFWNLAVPAEAQDMLDASEWTGSSQ